MVVVSSKFIFYFMKESLCGLHRGELEAVDPLCIHSGM